MTEFEEQSTLIEACKLFAAVYKDKRLAQIYHIPNGGQRHPAVAHKMRLLGVKPGVPDLHLPIASGKYHSLYIEMKQRNETRTRVSPAQDQTIQDLREFGHYVRVCYGAIDAWHTICEYLGMPQNRGFIEGVMECGRS